MANSVDPDQEQSNLSALLAYAICSESLVYEILRYLS